MKLSVGMTMPDFTVNTDKRDNVKLSEVVGEKNIFWVIRYIGCTVCRYDVHVLTQRYQEISEKGYKLFVVMQSDTDHVRRELAQQETPFEIICDNTFEIYNTLEIAPAASREELVGDAIDKLKEKGGKAKEAGFAHGDYEGNEQQLPALFLLNHNMDLFYSHYAKSISDMPDIDNILKLL